LFWAEVVTLSKESVAYEEDVKPASTKPMPLVEAKFLQVLIFIVLASNQRRSFRQFERKVKPSELSHLSSRRT
jgi:hypothetical protein